MTSKELQHQIVNNENLLILDVRENFELEICRMDDTKHIPMNLIPVCIADIPAEKDIVVVCHHGMRSAVIVHYLLKNGFKNVFNLDGGIHGWAIEIEPQMTKY